VDHVTGDIRPVAYVHNAELPRLLDILPSHTVGIDTLLPQTSYWVALGTNSPVNSGQQYSPQYLGASYSGVASFVPATVPVLQLAAFSYSSSPTSPLDVQFTDLSVPHPLYPTTQVNWDFGDASFNSTAAAPIHTFPSAGVYTVELTVTNSNGDSHSTSSIVSVPVPAPTTSPSSPTTTTGQPVRISVPDTSPTAFPVCSVLDLPFSSLGLDHQPTSVVVTFPSSLPASAFASVSITDPSLPLQPGSYGNVLRLIRLTPSPLPSGTHVLPATASFVNTNATTFDINLVLP
jgi:hypothetical protein